MSHSPGARAAEPLLDSSDEEDLGRSRRELGLGLGDDTQWRNDGTGSSERRHQLRSRSPGEVSRIANKQKVLLAVIALLISLMTFVVQTETAVYIQKNLGWNKAYCMLYMTHGSWTFLWPLQLLYLRLRKRSVPWKSFLRSHLQLVRTTAQMVQFKTNRISTAQSMTNPIPHFLKQIAIITSALTVAGSSWYIAVNMTTPSDLTAIYNCSAFFAYAFSIPLLHERVRPGKVVSVGVAILGVMIVAYGDGNGGQGAEGTSRVLGNLIIGVGSVLYGFYEVLYKKLACPPEATSPGRSVILANAVGSGIGFFTLSVLWIPLPILHWTGIEPFELPRGETAYMMGISILSNVGFSGAFLVLISLTSPVLSSVAALLTIFLVAITDWVITGVPLTFAAVGGGVMIICAFGLLSWDTWKELKEEEEKLLKRGDDVVDDEESVDGERGRTEERGRAEERGKLLREEGV
ncbi:hypothetical protein L211DRAFT_857266 [Terfezia boudieri ATCC MYA-4762]|uniref:EamA domain-containing protein n=1 Tax=Terfezia boudieri ATCC MYA-4762 TaxID=1051890 RepID=A0A3N4LN25_9PEZI|nr:hypothetical protein L211DRAFT_857266 [Terfezia boudieri ATCC MYA-4762]